MSYYVILDSNANLVEAFDREDEARAALEAIAHADPSTADEFAMLVYGDDGQPIGETLLGADIGVHA